MRLWTLLMVVMGLLGLFLVGCNSESADGTTGGGGADGEKLRIGVVIPTPTHGWTNGVNGWAEKMQAENPDVELLIKTGDSGAKQKEAIDTLLLQGLDGLVLLSFEPAPVTPAVKKAKDDGVYVVSVDRGLTEPVADVWMRGDNERFGQLAAEYIGEKLNGEGNILVLQGMLNDVNTARVEGFESVMSEKYPGITILAKEPGEWNRETAYKVTQTYLQKFPEVDAMWSSDDDMSLGAESALKEAGRTDIWMLGGGGMKDIIMRIKDGDPMYPATITYSPKMIADGIERCIADLKAGKKPSDTQEDVVLPVDVVTPENADDFYFEDSKY